MELETTMVLYTKIIQCTIGRIKILGEHLTAGLTPFFFPFDQLSIFRATAPSLGVSLLNFSKDTPRFIIKRPLLLN